MENVLFLGSVEGRAAEEQFIEQNSEGVEVDLVGMPRFGQHFGRHILRRPTVRVCNLILIDVWFGQSKISNFDLSLGVEQNVLQFDVSEQYIILVKVLQAVEYLHHQSFGLSLGEAAHALQAAVQIAEGTVLQAEDDVVFGLEGVQQVDQIFVAYAEENVAFVLEHFHLLGGGDRIFADEFEGAELVVQFAAGQEDLGEAAAAQKLADFEVRELQGFVADGSAQQAGRDGEFLDALLREGSEGVFVGGVEGFGELVVEGYGLPPHHTVHLLFALLRPLCERFVEVPQKYCQFGRQRVVFAERFLFGQQEVDFEHILSVFVFGGEVVVAVGVVAAQHFEAVHVEALLVGGGEVAEHGGLLVGGADGRPVEQVALVAVGDFLAGVGRSGLLPGFELGGAAGVEVGLVVGEFSEQLWGFGLGGGQLAQHFGGFRFGGVHEQKRQRLNIIASMIFSLSSRQVGLGTAFEGFWEIEGGYGNIDVDGFG